MTERPEGLKITSAEFLRTIFGRLAEGECITYTSARLKERKTAAGLDNYSYVTRRLHPGASKVRAGATHFCPTTLTEDEVLEDGRIIRSKTSLRRCHAIIADDIGEVKGDGKPPNRGLIGLPYSWSMETKPGSRQLGYIIDGGTDDLQAVEDLLYTMGLHGFTDPGAAKTTQIFRLPGSQPPGKPHDARLEAWHPDRRYTLAQVVAAVGVTLERRRASSGGSEAALAAGTSTANPFTDWVRDQDWYLGDTGRGGFEEIVCPWEHEHSDDRQATGYSPPTAQMPFHGFNCFHGHCADRKAREFLDWCVTQGAPKVDVMFEPVRDWDADGAMLVETMGLPPAPPSQGAQMQVAPRDLGERMVLDVIDPNDYADIGRRLGERLAEQDGAFLFGGVPVAMARRQSATAMVQVVDTLGRPVVDENGDAVTKPAETTQPVPLNHDGLTALLDGIAYFHKVKITQAGAVYTPVDPPKSLLGRMLAGVDDVALTSTLRVVRGLATHPIWYNGEMLSGERFHEASGIYLHTGVVVPEEDGFADAKAAWQFLRHDWLGDYPFFSEADAVVALTIPMTLLCAKSMLLNEAGPPAILISAPQAGTGKSYLAMQLMLAVTGELPAMTVYPDTEVERGKTITSTIIEGASYVLFDNIQTSAIIGNHHRKLTTLVTAPIWKDRILGVSATYTGPACIVPVLTGNNILAAEDMARRALTCRLENAEGVNSANKAYRRRSPFKWTIANRARILGAMAVILKAGGKGVAVQGTFPAWAHMVAAPLAKAGDVEGVFDAWVDAAETDAKGTVTRGADDVIRRMASLPDPVTGKPQDQAGSWFTAAEVMAACPTQINATLREGENASVEGIMHLMKRNMGVKVDDNLTLRGAKVNLQERTDRKPRWCFRVVRNREDAPMSDERTTNVLQGKFPKPK